LAGIRGDSGKITQPVPSIDGHVVCRSILASLVGVRWSGAGIDWASGVHMGATARLANADLSALNKTIKNASTESK
jgi:hypothetical protein